MSELVKCALLFLLCLLPGLEPRYGLALGKALGLPVSISLTVSCISVLVLAALLTIAVHLIDSVLRRFSTCSVALLRRVGLLYVRYTERVSRRVAKFRAATVTGLILFIAVPVPLTGMWTGAIAALLLRLSRRQMFTALVLGGLTSVMLVYLGISAVSISLAPACMSAVFIDHEYYVEQCLLYAESLRGQEERSSKVQAHS